MLEKQNKNSYKAPDLSRYETDVSGVSMKKLETGLWWIKNWGTIKKTLMILLIIVSVLSWAYTLYGFGYYFFKGINDDEKMIQQLATSAVVTPQYIEDHAAKDLSLSSVGILEDGQKYDFYISLRNINLDYWGSLSYCFVDGTTEVSCGNDFILPNDRKYITALAQDFKNRPVNTQFKIKSLTWNKIDPHQISDWTSYKNDRLNIQIKNIDFVPAVSSELSEKVNLSSLSFTATNNSAYSFYTAPLTILLFKNNQIIGISNYTINEFISLDDRQIKITWVGSFDKPDNIEVLPDINILDQNAYLKS